MNDRIPPVITSVGEALRKQPTGWQRPDCGLSGAERWVVEFSDGSSVFVKAATNEYTKNWLVNEHDALKVAGPRFAPKIIAWLEAEYPILVTEDMSAGYWPAGTGEVHWRPGDMQAVIATLEQLRAVAPVDGLPLVPHPPQVWDALLANPELARSGLCTPGWIELNGPEILAAEQVPIEPGRCLVHGDVRSDNLCIYPDGGVRFADWAQAGIGHPYHDLVTLLPTLRLEDGPRPSSVMSGHTGLIVRSAGATIARALGDENAPDWLRRVLLRLAAINLEWVTDILEIAPANEASQA